MTRKQPKITVQGTEIAIYTFEQKDYISLTDIGRYRNSDAPADVVKNWLRNRSTIEFLGLWEELNNPAFKLVEFDQFRNEAGSNYFVLSPKKWIETTNAIGITSKSGKYGGTFAQKDIATLEQLVVLSNLESYNSELIKQKIPPERRLEQLNRIAIDQMRILIENKSIKKIGLEK